MSVKNHQNDKKRQSEKEAILENLLGMVSHPKTRGSHYALSCCGIRERSSLGKSYPQNKIRSKTCFKD